jgi:hypothetical protein
MAKGTFVWAENPSNEAEQKSFKMIQEVVLKILDKETGKTQTFTTSLSKPIRYKSLIVRPRNCVKKKAGMAYEGSIF